ncbi:TPA: hypothetical protein HA235_07475 [Candidatus Woesearchaeota archaeon]|nr:hypothetical protein [Candidatus Woesearchaeota archaeon]HIH32518.1 hypothetical protein [Candidatus Woesearchaeota archaeon]HIH55106.1 hypothetical protein [Candidatus Woesearchaeota archaeon]HIJ01701.1 hypothetical protein [Candidatus Woesearchaeota archaeon]HIJ13259.1 hypothetical protein [Candidatus Woesearchaeota archaeon]
MTLFGLEDPFWDEFSKLSDAILAQEMRLITLESGMEYLIKFIKEVHEQANKLNYKIVNSSKNLEYKRKLIEENIEKNYTIKDYSKILIKNN